MENHATQMEHTTAPADKNSTNTIDFNSVIDLKGYAKGARVEIDSSVTERPGAGNGAPEIVAANEKVRVTENGHAIPEHVLNNLTLTDHGKNVRLNDNTSVIAGGPGAHGAHGEATHKKADEKGALPKLTIESLPGDTKQK